MNRSSLIVMALGLAACSKGKDNETAVTPAASKAVGSAAVPAEPPKTAALTSKLETARCDEPCLFLTDTPIDQVAAAFKTKCAGKADQTASLEDCTLVDYTRNCIYAAHGLVYKKGRWKKMFADKSWYEPHADVDAKALALSAVEHTNVHELYMRGKACKKHMEISGADYERIKKWFAALPKPPLPKVVAHFDNDSGELGMLPPDVLKSESGADFLAWFHGHEPAAKDEVKTGKGVTAVNVSAEDLAANKGILTALHVSDPSKLRAINVDFEVSSHPEEGVDAVEGTTLTFVYDDKDQLLGVFGEHYAAES
jgi:hypothetical protein